MVQRLEKEVRSQLCPPRIVAQKLTKVEERDPASLIRRALSFRYTVSSLPFSFAQPSRHLLLLFLPSNLQHSIVPLHQFGVLAVGLVMLERVLVPCSRAIQQLADFAVGVSGTTRSSISDRARGERRRFRVDSNLRQVNELWTRG